MRIYSIALLLVVVLVCFNMAPVGVRAQSGSLTGAGSTFVNPLMSKWSKEYHTLHPNVRNQLPVHRIGRWDGSSSWQRQLPSARATRR
jgi:ABC-type phosphate transport system substrate-binding protein